MIKKIKNKIKRIISNKTESNYSKTSYSQCGEDLIVKFIFDTLQIKQPSYLDVGAHHPFYLSNTALFYESGSRGINIEPDPYLFKSFLIDRANDINLNIGVDDKNTEQDFYIISSPTLNTFSKEEAEKYAKEGDYEIKEVKKIKVLSLKNIFSQYSINTFPQFLSVDAEGVDEIIIKQIDFEKNFPIVICLETISFSTSGKGIKNKSLIDFIKNQGYLVYADTYINTIFVRESFWQNREE